MNYTKLKQEFEQEKLKEYEEQVNLMYLEEMKQLNIEVLK